MKAEVEKNLQFTKLIKVENRLREFNFTRHTGFREGLFTVDVVDDRGIRHIFKMQRINDNWQIAEPGIPAWIIETEKSLHNLIAEEMQNFVKPFNTSHNQ